MSLKDASDTAVEELADSVWAIRVPMPAHPLRASFCYVYVGEGGASTVIDPGWPTEQSWTELSEALRRIGSAPELTESILLTHAHRDHSGLAGRLASVSGATVALHRADHALLTRQGTAQRDLVLEWLAKVGAVRGDDNPVAELGPALPHLPEPIVISRSLEDGAVISVPHGELTVHWTPGHTPGHVCFEDAARGLLFTGDHLLPRITPNISSMVGHRASALNDYLRSLAKVSGLAVERALPGHEYEFGDVGSRAAELLAHHRLRLDEILAVLRLEGERTTMEVSRDLTWSRPWEHITGLQQRAALGEVLAHLHFLHAAGAVHASASESPILWTLSSPEALDDAWRHWFYDVAR